MCQKLYFMSVSSTTLSVVSYIQRNVSIFLLLLDVRSFRVNLDFSLDFVIFSSHNLVEMFN